LGVQAETVVVVTSTATLHVTADANVRFVAIVADVRKL
jgi:hypothetical protein